MNSHLYSVRHANFRSKLLSISVLCVIFSGAFFMTFSSCGREQQIPIPYVPVNYTVYLNNPSNLHMGVPGGYLIMRDQGNHGIILYRTNNFGDSDDFVAFDLTCSHEPTGECIVEVDDTDFYLECPCCGSKFFIFDGYPSQGPALWPLKQYQTSFNGNTIRIYN